MLVVPLAARPDGGSMSAAALRSSFGPIVQLPVQVIARRVCRRGGASLPTSHTGSVARSLLILQSRSVPFGAGTLVALVAGRRCRRWRRWSLPEVRRCLSVSATAASTSSADDEPPSGPSEDTCSRNYELLRSVGEECQTEKELRNLVEKKPNFVLYDGFEPSGRMHIAQGIYKSVCVNKCTEAGGNFIFWVADWFALMNDKMGGDIDKIQTVGKYLIEVWKASGMDMSRVKFLWSSEQISSRAEEYWGQALDIAQRTTLARVKKCCQIMGRGEDSLTAAQILYPLMQCTDVFFLKADICQLGVDQRKVNMLARDYCDAAGRKLKPVILSHHMLFGLKKGQAKMSKSDPDSAIFMEDTREDVARKIQNAYCPATPEQSDAGEGASAESMLLVEDELKNPCLDYIRYVLFERAGYTFQVVGAQSYSCFDDLKQDFVEGKLSEAQLKESLTHEINVLLEPVRQHFENDPVAKDLLAKVTAWRRETLTPTSSLVRLSLNLGSDEALPKFVVFAPLPSEFVSMTDVMEVLQRLRLADEGQQKVLWLGDWSARCLGCLGGSVECLKAYYDLLLHGLHSLDPELMAGVQTCWQGEAILSGPSDYWTSVINVGRRCSLEEIRAALSEGESLDGAGQVLASIMHVGDLLALASSSFPITVCCAPSQKSQHALAAQKIGDFGLKVPEIHCLETPYLRLRAAGEGQEVDTQIFVTDKDMDVNRKVKKAFCEPGNVDFCPALDWVQVLLPSIPGAEFVVSRKPENGGDLRYEGTESLRQDFAAESLHPGDLKPALGSTVNAVMSGIREGLKASGDLKKAQKKLDQYRKSLQKKNKS